MTTIQKLNQEIENLELGIEILKLVNSISLSELAKNDAALNAVLNTLKKLETMKGVSL